MVRNKSETISHHCLLDKLDNTRQFDYLIPFKPGLLDINLLTSILILNILFLCYALPFTWYLFYY